MWYDAAWRRAVRRAATRCDVVCRDVCDVPLDGKGWGCDGMAKAGGDGREAVSPGIRMPPWAVRKVGSYFARIY